MKNTLIVIVMVAVCMALTPFASGAGLFDGSGVYTENFDSISATGTAAPPDWITGTYNPYRNRQLLDTDPAALVSQALTPDDGSSNVLARSYNYGTTGALDRAISHMGTTSNYGDSGLQVALINNTGAPITKLDIGYAGEQWRYSQGTSSSGPEMLRMYISPANTAGYIALPALNFTAPHQTGEPAERALDGNLADNRVLIESIVDLAALGYPGGAVGPGQLFHLTWHDWNDNATRDHGLAVDDVRIIAIPEPATLSLLALGGLALLSRRTK